MADIEPGRSVILVSAPLTLLAGLPEEDQQAVRSIVGRPVTYVGPNYGQAELEFVDNDGDGHTIWVDFSLLRPA